MSQPQTVLSAQTGLLPSGKVRERKRGGGGRGRERAKQCLLHFFVLYEVI